MNEHDPPNPLEAELAPFIERVRRDLERGERPSDVANWMHSQRLGNLRVMFTFMRATGVFLGDVKAMSRWWGANGVTDPDAFDEEARRLLAEVAGKR